ncbi:MAG: BolA family transcriptional regulator [Legionellales bacterium]|nr:BolA family transcriptional regulator [Legionellales bacterium]
MQIRISQQEFTRKSSLSHLSGSFLVSEANRIALIRECLEKTLNPSQLEIIDDSHLHAGHSGHGGAGHFQVRIVSDKFNNLAILARHRLVYSALEKMMQTEIHALSIEARTLDETE